MTVLSSNLLCPLIASVKRPPSSRCDLPRLYPRPGGRCALGDRLESMSLPGLSRSKSLRVEKREGGTPLIVRVRFSLPVIVAVIVGRFPEISVYDYEDDYDKRFRIGSCCCPILIRRSPVSTLHNWAWPVPL